MATMEATIIYSNQARAKMIMLVWTRGVLRSSMLAVMELKARTCMACRTLALEVEVTSSWATKI